MNLVAPPPTFRYPNITNIRVPEGRNSPVFVFFPEKYRDNCKTPVLQLQPLKNSLHAVAVFFVPLFSQKPLLFVSYFIPYINAKEARYGH
jgi:hypothetical protein